MSKGKIEHCNRKLYKEVAEEMNLEAKNRRMKTTSQQVQEIFEFSMGFVDQTIARGLLEGVALPYFGKFKIKEDRFQYINHMKSFVSKNPILRQLEQARLKHIFKDGKTIRDRGRLEGEAESGMADDHSGVQDAD